MIRIYVVSGDTMVSLSFYGGVGEIGGNKILLEDEDTKIFLDFGMSFGKRSLFFEEFLTPRTANGIGDFLELGLIPDLPGIYRKDLLTHQGKKAEDPVVQAVLLSHAHADHANYVSFLHKDIPIYCEKVTKRILDAVDEQSQRSIESEVLNFKERPLYRKDYRKPAVKRSFHLFKSNDTVHIDSLDIQPVHVDHSVPGACGFIIHTSKGPLVYTGDLRMHGIRHEHTADFITEAIQTKPLAVITEGTRIDEKRTAVTEQTVYRKSKKVLAKNRNISIVDFNFKDVDRFSTFYRIAKELDKQLVISFKHACFLEQYHQAEELRTPHSTDDRINILLPKRNTGTYDINEDYRDKFIRKRLHYPNIITAEEIRKHPSKYMIVLNYWYFNAMVDLKPYQGTYVHSLSEPFNEEMEISYERMKNWLDNFDINLVQSHCSGHINGEDLKTMLTQINPKKVFPIHTIHPQQFQTLDLKTIMIEEGKTYKL
ncbi:MAG: MBL fold metallo-hydrolase [Candidatus Thermoplasmatota archaeon]|nr:MBL fold metallo-hydrolase [Candidatus Thermoplasmatota archaeon]